MFRKSFNSFFRRRGYDVLLYNNANDAVDAIVDGLKYSLLITDLTLGEIRFGIRFSGQDVVDVSKNCNPSVPVISMSGYDEKIEGAREHLRKPVTLHSLAEVVSPIREGEHLFLSE
jgi:CheY-like chemotaxis protein